MKSYFRERELWDTHKSCPKCGNFRNQYYTEWVEFSKTDDDISYKVIVNYICQNKNCGYRWEVE